MWISVYWYYTIHRWIISIFCVSTYTNNGQSCLFDCNPHSLSHKNDRCVHSDKYSMFFTSLHQNKFWQQPRHAWTFPDAHSTRCSTFLSSTMNTSIPRQPPRASWSHSQTILMVGARKEWMQFSCEPKTATRQIQRCKLKSLGERIMPAAKTHDLHRPSPAVLIYLELLTTAASPDPK